MVIHVDCTSAKIAAKSSVKNATREERQNTTACVRFAIVPIGVMCTGRRTLEEIFLESIDRDIIHVGDIKWHIAKTVARNYLLGHVFARNAVNPLLIWSW